MTYNTIKLLSIAAGAVFFAGCTTTRYMNVATPPAPPAGKPLQACTTHAAKAQRAAFGNEFRGLQLDALQAVLVAPSLPVGAQPVAAAYDGEGTWFGQPQGTMGEWRKVRYHCLLNPAGQVVYSFVRAQ